MKPSSIFRCSYTFFFLITAICATAPVQAQTVWQTTRAVPLNSNNSATYTEVIKGPSIGAHLNEFLALRTVSVNNYYGLEFAASADGGVTWQDRGGLQIIGGTTGGSNLVFKLAYGHQGYILVNTSNFCNPSSASGNIAQTCMWRSTDAIDWIPVTLATSLQQFFSITYGNGRYAVMGQQGFGPCISNGVQDGRSRCHISTSTNGISWDDQLSNSNGIDPITQYNRGPVSFLNGRFLFDGYSGTGTGSNDTRFWSSADGVSWTAVSNRVGNDTCKFSSGVAYGNSQYVAFSTNPNVVCVSPDATQWSGKPIVGTVKPGFTSRGLIFFAGAFYSLYTSQSVPRSISGRSWAIDITDPTQLYAIAADDEHAVQVGVVAQAGKGFLYASSDRIFSSGVDNE